MYVVWLLSVTTDIRQHADEEHEDRSSENDGCQLEITIRRATSHLSLGLGLGLRQTSVDD